MLSTHLVLTGSQDQQIGVASYFSSRSVDFCRIYEFTVMLNATTEQCTMGSYNTRQWTTHQKLLMHCLTLKPLCRAHLQGIHCNVVSSLHFREPVSTSLLRCWAAIINLPPLLLSLSLETTVLSAAAACFRQSTCTCLVSTTSTAPMVNCKSTFF